MAFASIETESQITNQQEAFSQYKTKSSNALVLHETSVHSLEILESFPTHFYGKQAEILLALSEIKHMPVFGSQISDKKHFLTLQIFPFHFHF